MNEMKSNENENNIKGLGEATLSNDPIFVNDEIEALHRKIFHLRRTNTEIRKFYSDDPDCVEALKENAVVIERTLNSLFIYFELYHQLTQKKHFYTKLYESDLKIKQKLDQKATSSNKLKEFDLDYVAQRLKDKSKELELQKNAQNDVSCNIAHDQPTKNKTDKDSGFIL